MSVTPPIFKDLWDQIPAARAAIAAVVESLERRIAARVCTRHSSC
jgi:hypothetical protein